MNTKENYSNNIERGVTYLEYPALFDVGEVLSRRDVAGRAGRHYSTAVYHLERAVGMGLINRAYGFIDRQPGWVYALPETMPELP